MPGGPGIIYFDHFDGLGKFRLEFLFEYRYQFILNQIRKERWQIDKIDGGVTRADPKSDVLEIGCFIDDANELPASWAAGLCDGDSVFSLFLNLHNLVS